MNRLSYYSPGGSLTFFPTTLLLTLFQTHWPPSCLRAFAFLFLCPDALHPISMWLAPCPPSGFTPIAPSQRGLPPNTLFKITTLPPSFPTLFSPKHELPSPRLYILLPDCVHCLSGPLGSTFLQAGISVRLVHCCVPGTSSD